MRNEQRRDAWLAWHTAYLGAYHPSEAKHFPKLQSLLPPSGREPAPTRDWRTLFEMMKGICET